MTIIPRSPYTFVMEKDAMNLKLTTAPIESGFVEWPVYEVNGVYYLQNIFEFHIPKGVNVVKVNLDVYQGLVVSKCTITNSFGNTIWLKTLQNGSPVYPYVGVTQNCLYTLKVDDMTMINYSKGSLKLEWGYRINQVEPTVLDYME